ncbi:MAG: DUF2970 domain-containing protein [Gammaproteobacteria bacterium]|nr:DUF2970 domain-containing protein [Gammaproteobacteria bacterium]
MRYVAVNSGNSPRRATPLQAAKAVFWAFFGVRRGKDHASVRLTPLQVIAAGVIGATLFVITIVSVVQLVTR